MNPNGILTTYEERMKANLQQYQRPEKAGRPGHSACALITAPGASTCACSATSPIWTPARRSAWPAARGAGERYAPRKCTIDFAKAHDRTVWRCTLAANVYGIIDWIDAEPM